MQQAQAVPTTTASAAPASPASAEGPISTQPGTTPANLADALAGADAATVQELTDAYLANKFPEMNGLAPVAQPAVAASPAPEADASTAEPLEGATVDPAAAPAGEATETTASAEPTEATQEPPAPEGESLEDPTQIPNRIRLTHLPEERKALIARLARNPDAPIETLIPGLAKAPTAPAQPADAAATTEPAAATPQPSVTELEARITELKASKKAAIAGVDFDRAAEIEEQLDDAKDQLAAVRAQAASQQSAAVEAFHNALDASKAQAITLFPAVKDHGSPLVAEMRRIDAELRANGDPTFDSPNKPLLVTLMAAQRLGIAAAAPAPATPAPTAATPKPAPAPASAPAARPAQPAPARPATPIAPGGARTSASAISPGAPALRGAPTAADLLKDVKSSNAYLDKLEELGFRVG